MVWIVQEGISKFDIAGKHDVPDGWVKRNKIYSETGVEKGRKTNRRVERLPELPTESGVVIPVEPDDLD